MNYKILSLVVIVFLISLNTVSAQISESDYTILKRNHEVEIRFDNMQLASRQVTKEEDLNLEITDYVGKAKIRLLDNSTGTLRNIDTRDFIINSNTKLIEIFDGCSEYGRIGDAWGCSAFTSVNVLGHKIDEATWWNETWESCVNITINSSKVGEDLTNFPMVVRFNNTNMDYSKTQNLGQDLRFINASCSDGGIQLSHEIEIWDEGGDSYVWVLVPIVNSSSDTQFSVYFNNPNAEDDQDPYTLWSDYEFVQHMDETTGTYNDSTVNGNNGTLTDGDGDSTRGIASQIGTALSLQGDADYVNFSDSSSLNLDRSYEITYQFWVKTDLPNQNSVVLSKQSSSTLEGYHVGLHQSNHFMMYIRDTSSNDFSIGTEDDNMEDDNWHKVVWVYNSTPDSDLGMTFFLDGIDNRTAFDSGTLTASISNTVPLCMGVRCDDLALGYYRGVIDEVRLARNVRSAEWVETEYYSETYQLLSFDPVQDVVPTPTPPTDTGFTYDYSRDIPLKYEICLDETYLLSVYERWDCINDTTCLLRQSNSTRYCYDGCDNSSLSRFGNPGCKESPIVIWGLSLIIIIISSVIFWRVLNAN